MNKRFGIKTVAAALISLLAAGMLTSCLPYLEINDITLPPETSSPEPEITTAEETTASPEVTTEEETTSAPETTAEETTLPETTVEETTEEVTTEPETTPEPEVTETPWYLVLVNPWHPLPEDYQFELTTVTGKYKIDSRCADALGQFLADCKAAGHTPYICSAYRTWDDQVYLFDKKVKSFTSKGYSEEEAKILAAKETAVPGTSEHQLGLAVDILCQSRPWLDEGQANTATQKWLMANCHKYGFILRYPKGTTPITGIIYEPWHYRYVGVEIATEIMTKGITLEEYLGIIGPPEETTTPEEITVNE
ncbi:MAG: M15 family metallopeptidase [Clostridia bacterium]|nr:M15 family metallopeptidase [Clostridia bacterium]